MATPARWGLLAVLFLALTGAAVAQQSTPIPGPGPQVIPCCFYFGFSGSFLPPAAGHPAGGGVAFEGGADDSALANNGGFVGAYRFEFNDIGGHPGGDIEFVPMFNLGNFATAQPIAILPYAECGLGLHVGAPYRFYIAPGAGMMIRYSDTKALFAEFRWRQPAGKWPGSAEVVVGIRFFVPD